MNFLRNNFAAIILILSAIILRLLAALFPPSQILYSIDERIMVDSSLLLFTNSTPTCLEWPATTLMIPLFFFSFLCMIVSSDFVSAARHFDMIKISDVVNSHLYNNFNADDLIITGRILIALIGLISYFFLFNFLQGEKRVFKLFFIFLYTYSAAVITQSWVLHPDSAAIIFWVLFIAYYMFRFNLKDDRSIGWLALLYALLVASKFTYAIFFPILLLSFLFLNFPENKLKIVLTQSCKFLVISGILLLALLPFIWTNSLTFA